MNSLIFNNASSFKIGNENANVYLGNELLNRYKQVEYITSTLNGGQYIDLGCKLFEDDNPIELEIKYNFWGIGKGGDNLATLIGANDESNSSYPGMVLRRNNMQSQFKIKYTKYDSWVNGEQKYSSYDSGNYKIECSSIGDITILKVSTTEFDVNGSSNHDKTTMLFCALNSSGVPFRFCRADLYYLKISKNRQVIRDLIPVYDLVSKEYGLYDKLNKVFYKSQGDEPFVA